MKRYKLSLDESIPNSLQVNTVITVDADTLVGLLSKFLLAMTAYEERVMERIKLDAHFKRIVEDDIPF